MLVGYGAAAAAAGGVALEEVELQHWNAPWPFTVGGWVAALRNSGLRCLRLEANDLNADTEHPLVVASPALQGLTELQELELRAMDADVLPSARLPASLTKVHLRRLDDGRLPAQVGWGAVGAGWSWMCVCAGAGCLWMLVLAVGKCWLFWLLAIAT